MLPAMPLEGHYNRVNTPLRKLTPRERNVLHRGSRGDARSRCSRCCSSPPTIESPLLDENGGARSGCIEVAVAGRVGSEPIVGCGAKAEQICVKSANFDSPRSETITNACTEAGVRF